MMVQRLQRTGAIVHVKGANWNEADAYARESLAKDSSAIYIPPFDHPLIWEGHSSIVDEIESSFQQRGLISSPPDAIVLSVGGGGLLRGVQLGLERLGWKHTEILAVETEGAASFHAAIKGNAVVRLNAITSLATSLGALAVTPTVLETSIISTLSIIVTDADAVNACTSFANEYRFLVEPACGAALSLLFLNKYEELMSKYKSVVIVVCGGGAVNLELLSRWREKVAESHTKL